MADGGSRQIGVVQTLEDAITIREVGSVAVPVTVSASLFFALSLHHTRCVEVVDPSGGI
jgi:hypothetical protein